MQKIDIRLGKIITNFTKKSVFPKIWFFAFSSRDLLYGACCCYCARYGHIKIVCQSYLEDIIVCFEIGTILKPHNANRDF